MIDEDLLLGDAILSVREMRIEDADIRIGYFHDSTDEHLARLGVNRSLLPTRAQWRSHYELDAARPVPERQEYSLLWLRNSDIVGFSSTDRITFGEEAFMHLHLLDGDLRNAGLGTEFVRQSARTYFEVLQLDRLYCEPNALNVAPNRTVQAAGFRYLFSHHATPSPINMPQISTRWVLDRPS